MKKVYIHGLGQTSESWDMVFKHLGNSGDQVCLNLAELVQDKEVTYHTLYTAFAMVCNAIEEPISLCSLSLGVGDFMSCHQTAHTSCHWIAPFSGNGNL